MKARRRGVAAIAVTQIRAWGHHGADLGEQATAQPIDVEFTVHGPWHRATRSDDLGDTVDYAMLHACVVRVVRERRCRLLEALAGAILDALFAADARIASASVRLSKPRKLDGATPAVELRRARP